MQLFSENENYKLYNGSMLDMLEVIEKNSIDSIVTDPPYELGFMNKGWDSSGIAFQKDTWEKCLEVLKPGGYLLAFGGSRTFHRIACAIEDAGFEVRDTIMWLYGSGFIKSMNIALQFDKEEGLQGQRGLGGINVGGKGEQNNRSAVLYSKTDSDNSDQGGYTEPKGENAKKWFGWGTALKPAYEPVIVARKPLDGSTTNNLKKYGVGGFNLDECRIGNETRTYKNQSLKKPEGAGCFRDDNWIPKQYEKTVNGRIPSNVILTYDETDFDEVCGGMPVGGKNGNITKNYKMNNQVYGEYGYCNTFDAYEDSGSAARYFMNCKLSDKDGEPWRLLFVNNVETNFRTLKAIRESFAQKNVLTMLKELKENYARYVESPLDLQETLIAQEVAGILTWDFKIETSQVIQDFIINSKKCTQLLNLVQFVEQMDSIDTTPITQNLLKLFGYVRVVITNYILGNIELDQNRYMYAPKASTKDRDEGLEEFEKVVDCDRHLDCDKNSDYHSANTPMNRTAVAKRNTHPTVKPTELMQYLIRLVTPNGGTILDPFNGSGSTGKAAMWENRERNKDYKYIGIEITESYLPIARARIEYALVAPTEEQQEQIPGQMSLFD